MKKILLYHLYALPTELVFFNLAKIFEKINLFDRIIFKICYENELAICAENIQNYILSKNFKNCEIYKIQNSQIREGTGFSELITKILTEEKEGYIFYAHTKGGSVHINHPNYKYFNNILDWAEVMYEYNLKEENIKIIEKEKVFAAGCFQNGFGHEPFYGSLWHYSGSFYWINIEKLSKSNWQNFSFTPYMTESYPGRIADIKDTISFVTVNSDLYLNNVKKLILEKTK